MTRRQFFAGGVVIGVLSATASLVTAQGVTGSRGTRSRPYNAVVIILDTSASFLRAAREPGVEGKVLFDEAFGVVERFLAKASERRERRKEGEDQYFIVAADAASQLVWSGSRQALAGLTPAILKEKLAVRRQFANCTDIAGALNAAATIVREHERASERVVLTFSDLINEPPIGSYSRCAKASGQPPADIRWQDLAEARLGFYFVSKRFEDGRPDKQWADELARQNITAKFLDAAQTLTVGIDVTPPPSARRRITEKERDAEQKSIDTFGSHLVTLARFAAGGLALVVAAVVGTVALRWYRVRARRTTGTA